MAVMGPQSELLWRSIPTLEHRHTQHSETSTYCEVDGRLRSQERFEEYIRVVFHWVPENNVLSNRMPRKAVLLRRQARCEDDRARVEIRVK